MEDFFPRAMGKFLEKRFLENEGLIENYSEKIMFEVNWEKLSNCRFLKIRPELQSGRQ